MPTLAPPLAVPARSRVLVAGLPGPAAAWLAHATALLLGQNKNTSVWTGWAKDLPAGKWPPMAAVVRVHDYLPAMADTADHVIFAARDLRDAVLALHRGFNVSPDPTAAHYLLQRAVAWEARAEWVTSFEAVMMDPRSVLLKLARRLNIVPDEPEKLLAALKAGWDSATDPRDLRQVQAGGYRVGLAADVIAMIERHFGSWLVQHGYTCESCSTPWAGVTPEGAPAARLGLFRRLRSLAVGLGVNDLNAELPCRPEPKAIDELRSTLREFGHGTYQRMAVELLDVLAPTDLGLIVAGAEILTELGETNAAAQRLRSWPAGWRDDRVLEFPRRCPSGIAPPVFSRENAVATDLKTAALSYLPVRRSVDHPSETVRRMAAQVRGRTVGFLLHGSSVQQFSNHAATLARQDVVWMSLNHFSLLESKLLRPVGSEMSLVFCCADGEVQRRIEDLVEFLGRPSPRLLITRPDHMVAFAAKLEPRRNLIALELLPPLWPYPNSLELCLRLLVQSGPRRIVLFGADGYLGENDAPISTYFGAEEFVKEKRYSGVLLDTLLFNAHMPRVLAAWRRRLGPECPEILNCSPGTLLKGFENIDYSQAEDALSGRPVTVLPQREPRPLTEPLPMGEGDVVPLLIACANAARRGDLSEARTKALEALMLAPTRLTPLAYRVLQTDVRWMTAARAALGLTGADQPDAPDHWRWLDLTRELKDAAAAYPVERWEQWE